MTKNTYPAVITAVNDLCIYCLYHECDDTNPATRCRIKDIISCRKLHCNTPRLWDVDTRVLKEGIDAELIDTLNTLKNTCENRDCSQCPIKNHSKCVKKTHKRIICPGDWDTNLGIM